MEKKNIIAGVDIGGTNTAIGFLDPRNNFLYENTFLTESQYGPERFVQALSRKIKDAFNNFSDHYNLGGISLAAPSANYLSGTIESSANLGWENVNLVDMMKKYFEIPVVILNDGNAAAIGESVDGAAVGMKDFIVLTLGTGLGSGIMINGEPLYGHNGLAGELGHMTIKEGGRKCKCGKSGCLETYVSARGLCRTVYSHLSYYDDPSELRNMAYNNLTSLYVSDLARNGDTIALKAFNYTGKILGEALANVVTCFNPEAIILFGGLADSGDLLLKPTELFFEKYLLNIYKNKVKILKSELQNGKAAILGACNFIINELNKKQIELKLYQ